MVLLNSAHLKIFVLQRLNGIHAGLCGSQGGAIGGFGGNGGGTDDDVVRPCVVGAGGVDDEINIPVFNMVHDVGAARLVDFVGAFAFNVVLEQVNQKNKELAETFVDFYLSKEVQLAEALDGVDAPVRTDVELTPEQAANFTYGKEMIDSLLIPDWSVINANKADWIAKWNELFSVQ